MAHAGIASRRDCEKLIEQGRVKINGRVASLGDKADPNRDKIEVNGRLINQITPEFIYIALNKPKGIISSLEDELNRGRKTVRDMIPVPGHLYPVGRLDKQSEGLILMTNDGELAHKLTHPSYGHTKQYHVVVEGMISDPSIEKWSRGGMPLDGRMALPAEIEVIRRQKGFTQLKIILREGRKRQIRRIANMLGHPVKSLVRERIGPISLGKLQSGQWRHLSPAEIDALKKSVNEKKAKKRRPPRSKFKKPYAKKRPVENKPRPSKVEGRKPKQKR